MENQNQILPKILEYWIGQNASDIHISEWEKFFFRINWKLIWWGEPIDNIKIKLILLELVRDNKEEAKKFLNEKDMDFTYIYRDWISYRVNAFFKSWKIWFILRYINPKIKSISELNLPEWVSHIVNSRQWLVLITWTSWSWKSTSLASILNEINQNRSAHIVTLENPIEFRFTNNKSIFSQREVWKDTNNFISWLESVKKEDPDIIVISEIKDRETLEKAIELSEWWKLVISTITSWTSIWAIIKCIDMYPPELQESIKSKLSEVLKWIMNQKLIPKSDASWLIWIFELLLFNMWVKNLVKSWDFNQLKWQIETWEKHWMILMKKYAQKLEEEWKIKNEDYIDLLPPED